MNATTEAIDVTTSFEDYTEDDGETFHTCDRGDDNRLGALLSYLYYFMFAFSLLGNGLVLLIIYRFEKLTTVTNIFLLNLVVSDLIFMSSLPFWGIYQQLANWVFGGTMCKIVGSTYFLGFYSSVLFLTLLTFDRHLAVVYSLAALRVRTPGYAVISCAVVWLASGLACIKPMILYTAFTDYTNKTYCEENPLDSISIDVALLESAGKYLQLFLFFLFPLAVIIYCYVRITITVILSKMVTKFRTVRLIFVIVLLFFLCWTPYNIVLVMHDGPTDCDEMRSMGYALQVTQNIAYLYFCISPIFYTFVGKRFQNHCQQLLEKHFSCLREHVVISQTSKTNLSPKNAPNRTFSSSRPPCVYGHHAMRF